MGALYVTVTTRMSRPRELRTGIPRVEHEIARALAERGGRVLRYNRLLRRFGIGGLRSEAAQRGDGKASGLQQGGTIVVPGILWRQGQLDGLDRIRRQYRMRLGVYIHDIMPIRRPELVSNESGAADFRRFVDAMVGCADWLAVSSDFVAQDLQAYIRETTKREVPIHHVPLCADLKDRVAGTRTARLRALGLKDDGYALYVSTLNPRKNQIWLYHLWRRLAEELGEATPPLVLAGQRGWNDRDTLDLMSRDPFMWGRHIHFVEAPSDEELVELYRNCAFTMFPSVYEGWGLPITESLSFGKPSIAADNTSLREAGQGLAEHIANHDGPGWLAAIRRLALDGSHRGETSARIESQYKARRWSDVGEDIVHVAGA
jgi:glycosyltransferase involved in cell wall biosynthesis